MSERPSHREKISNILNDVDPGNAEFKLVISERYIKPRVRDWKANILGKGFYEDYVNRYAYRNFDAETKKWVIDKEETVSQIEHRVLGLTDTIFKKCSPNKAPRRTKIYKSFREVLYANKGTIDFMSSVFDIAEYYTSVTDLISIENTQNDVHRKNIYQLLCLMEKNYDNSKNKKNSNG